MKGAQDAGGGGPGAGGGIFFSSVERKVGGNT